STQSVQNRQRPKSSRGAPAGNVIASVGHASAQARQPSGQRDASITGKPRKRSGSVGSWAGYGIVRCPCFTRARGTCSIVVLCRQALVINDQSVVACSLGISLDSRRATNDQ